MSKEIYLLRILYKTFSYRILISTYLFFYSMSIIVRNKIKYSNILFDIIIIYDK